MLDYDYVLMSIVLELMHDSSYLNMWVYDGFIDDVIVVYRVTYRHVGYSYVVLEWYAICDKVKYCMCLLFVHLCPLLDTCMNVNMRCIDLGF